MSIVSAGPRIAIGSFMLESNAHAPVATREEFAQNVLLAPEELLADLRSAHPRSPGCLAGFFDEIERIAPSPGGFAGWWTPPAGTTDDSAPQWQPVPMIVAAVGASGPIDQHWF